MFPALVIGVRGRQQHLMDSPSYSNLGECSKVLEVCTLLLQESHLNVKASDIGIIAAFRSQVLALRLVLRAQGLRGVSVGSVEDFQGQENRVIIISTVLSTLPPLESGEHIGLFGDSRRFNVAVTRAQALVVVIGHPHVLYLDRYFRQFLEYCLKNKAAIGFDSDDGNSSSPQDVLHSLGRESALGEKAHVNYYSDNQEWRVML